MRSSPSAVRACLLVLAGVCLPGAAAGAAPAKEERIRLKTPTRTFTAAHEFALEDGRIYWRPNAGEGAPGDWRLLGPEGLPFREGGLDEAPARIATITSDLRFLIAISDTGRVYDIEFPGRGVDAKWEDKWGMPFRMMPGPVRIPKDTLVASVSLLQDNWSEDIDGNPHQVIGIHTLYTLVGGGHVIAFNDPWLPPNDFAMRFSTPERGRFTAINLTTSGSTLMVVDATGALWTRLIDFDTMGGNPGIRYSHERRTRVLAPEHPFTFLQSRLPMWFDTRTLPPEPWKPQPRPAGRITKRMAIVQTGKGNAARELRVEGESGGATGYFRKPVDADAWTFVATGHVLTEPFLDPAADPRKGPGHEWDLAGRASFVEPRVGLEASTTARLNGFNFLFDAMSIELDYLGKRIPLEFRIDANMYPLETGGEAFTTGALVVPASVRGSRDPRVQAFVARFFPRREWTPVDVRVSPAHVMVFPNPARSRTSASFAFSFERPAPVRAAAVE